MQEAERSVWGSSWYTEYMPVSKWPLGSYYSHNLGTQSTMGSPSQWTNSFSGFISNESFFLGSRALKKDRFGGFIPHEWEALGGAQESVFSTRSMCDFSFSFLFLLLLFIFFLSFFFWKKTFGKLSTTLGQWFLNIPEKNYQKVLVKNTNMYPAYPRPTEPVCKEFPLPGRGLKFNECPRWFLSGKFGNAGKYL